MRILVTGFDPFGTDKINPAIEAVKLLPAEINDAEIIKLKIPTIFNKCAEVVHQAIIEYRPDYVISIGQAGGRGVAADAQLVSGASQSQAAVTGGARLPGVHPQRAGADYCAG